MSKTSFAGQSIAASTNATAVHRLPTQLMPLAFETERKLAIVLGVDDYRNGISPLRNAVNDTRAVAAVLHDQHGYEIRPLINQDATRDRLSQFFDRLASEVDDKHRVVFYFAGHGILNDPPDDEGHAINGAHGYLLLHDAHSAQSDTFLPMADLFAQIRKLRCRHLLAILDCCYAGAAR